ncbi:PQQ-binding-like beta-propeller repeat protein [Fuerstiella marisgermanici]|uniref:Outer membrane biogenesis protein n=1 Tax=Fuerstiella marisgermanici TaxID=1891926 RepID=A0A1P8WQM5_9PLAN|nr:PQQ-binding-like beta-propeller repeat protein [Fuerstiella marisgermanici]APZ96349.1 outer membrane biogenesis protein [Fuerstiella marisgermanici]
MNKTFLIVLTALLPLTFANAGEWARFRGPNGTGVGSGDIPVEFSEADFDFNVKLPGGTGCSSPVVWGDKVFVLSANADDATRYVCCFHALTGEKQWQKEYESKPHHLHTRSSYASSTPAVDEERVYVAWSTPEAVTFKAFTHDGEEAWSLDLGTWQSQHGFGASPIIYKDMVILHNSQQANQLDAGEKPGESFMMAFDRKTGDEQWRTELVSKNVCYSAPFIRQSADGKDELICCSTGNGIFSLDPMTGQKNWEVNDKLFKMRTVASPIEVGGLIFGSNGSGGYSSNYVVAVQPGSNGNVVHKIANSGKFKAPYVPGLIADGDMVYCLYDRGYASCLNAKTGEILWIERTGAAFSGSPVRVDDRIYCVDEVGMVWVIAATPEKYTLLAKNALGEESKATPAIANDRLYLRTDSRLISVGGKKAAGS